MRNFSIDIIWAKIQMAAAMIGGWLGYLLGGLDGLMIALIAFVGIPIPGTGAWTGTLGASFLDLGIKKTVVSVTLGVVAAAVIMASVSHVGLHVFGM